MEWLVEKQVEVSMCEVNRVDNCEARTDEQKYVDIHEKHLNGQT